MELLVVELLIRMHYKYVITWLLNIFRIIEVYLFLRMDKLSMLWFNFWYKLNRNNFRKQNYLYEYSTNIRNIAKENISPNSYLKTS